MAEDEIKTTIALTAAINDLNQANAGLVAGFGELSKNRVWTVISRFASGTSFWKLQNYVRAIATMTDLYNKRLSKNREEMIKGLESNLKLTESYANLKNEMEGLEKSPASNKIYQMILDTGVGHKKALEASKEYYRGTKKEMEDLIKFRNKKLKKQITKKASTFFGGEEGILNLSKRYKEQVANVEAKAGPGGRFDARMKFLGRELGGRGFGKTVEKGKDFFLGKKNMWNVEKGKMVRPGFKAQAKKGIEKVKEKLFSGAFKIWKNISAFFTIGAVVLGKAMMYFALFLLAITVIVAIIRKIWPFLKDAFTKSSKRFEAAWELLGGILYDFYEIFVAMWNGEWLKVLKIYFFELLPKVLTFIGNLIVGITQVLLTLIYDLSKGLVKTVFGLFYDLQNLIFEKLDDKFGGKYVSGAKKVWGYTPTGFLMNKTADFLGYKAKGGLIGRHGYAVVGEKGPELVSLPAGARVHSNTQSQAMMGHTINIHVNGRVGATDAEIKDIANKLSAEMNRRINRTNRSVNAF